MTRTGSGPIIGTKTSDMVSVRPVTATLRDARAINAIYNPYVENAVATFETVPVTDRDRLAFLTTHLADDRYPAVIATVGNQPAGFAQAAPFDPRPAYGVSIKTSVFVAGSFAGDQSDKRGGNGNTPRAVPAGFAGRGIGKMLYRALFEALSAPIESGKLHRAYGLIVAPNAPSAALHEGFGFAHIATLREVGRKFDRYHDVMWFEKRLS